MVSRRNAVRIIEARGSDVDLVCRGIELERQRRAAFGTEAARRLRARAEAPRLPRHAKLRARHAEPCHERRARGAPAHRAVADGRVIGRAARFITHAPAETTSSKHAAIVQRSPAPAYR